MVAGEVGQGDELPHALQGLLQGAVVPVQEEDGLLGGFARLLVDVPGRAEPCAREQAVDGGL